MFALTHPGSSDASLAHLQIWHQYNLEIAELVQCPKSWQDSDTAGWLLRWGCLSQTQLETLCWTAAELPLVLTSQVLLIIFSKYFRGILEQTLLFFIVIIVTIGSLTASIFPYPWHPCPADQKEQSRAVWVSGFTSPMGVGAMPWQIRPGH